MCCVGCLHVCVLCVCCVLCVQNFWWVSSRFLVDVFKILGFSAGPPPPPPPEGPPRERPSAGPPKISSCGPATIERRKNDFRREREKKKREILGPFGRHHTGPPTAPPQHPHNEHPTTAPKKKKDAVWPNSVNNLVQVWPLPPRAEQPDDLAQETQQSALPPRQPERCVSRPGLGHFLNETEGPLRSIGLPSREGQPRDDTTLLRRGSELASLSRQAWVRTAPSTAAAFGRGAPQQVNALCEPTPQLRARHWDQHGRSCPATWRCV